MIGMEYKSGVPQYKDFNILSFVKFYEIHLMQ